MILKIFGKNSHNRNGHFQEFTPVMIVVFSPQKWKFMLKNESFEISRNSAYVLYLIKYILLTCTHQRKRLSNPNLIWEVFLWLSMLFSDKRLLYTAQCKMNRYQRRTENRLDSCRMLWFQLPLHLEKICRKDHRLKIDVILTTGGTRG